MDKFLIYAIIFLPLITSLFCQFFSKTKIVFSLTLACFATIFILLIKIYPEVFLQQNIANNFNINFLSLALTFNIDANSLLFLFAIIFLNFIFLFYYYKNLDLFLEQKSHKFFYATYLLKTFAVIGLVTSDNFLNLFLFLECYNLSFFAILSIINNKKTLNLYFKYFSINALASILALFCFIIIYLTFDNLNLETIKQNLISSKDIRFLAIISSLMALAFIAKFLPFWIYFSNLKNNNSFVNFVDIDALFIKANIAIFLAIKFSYLFFKNIFIAKIIILFLLCVIFYTLYKLYSAKHLKLIAIYFAIINLCLIFISLALNFTKNSVPTFFYWLNFNLVNLAFFFFAEFLKQNIKTSNFEKIKTLESAYLLTLSLRILMIFFATIPVSFAFYGNWFLLMQSLNFDLKLINFLTILALIFCNIISLILALKILENLFFIKEDYSKKKLVKPLNERLYGLSILFIIMAILILLFSSNLLNKLSLNFVIL